MTMDVSQQQTSVLGSMVKGGAIGAGVGVGAGLASITTVGNFYKNMPKDSVNFALKEGLAAMKNPSGVNAYINGLKPGIGKTLLTKMYSKVPNLGIKNSTSRNSIAATLKFARATAQKGKIAWGKIPMNVLKGPAIVLGIGAAAIAGLVALCKK